jgi:hypothetical protein
MDMCLLQPLDRPRQCSDLGWGGHCCHQREVFVDTATLCFVAAVQSLLEIYSELRVLG